MVNTVERFNPLDRVKFVQISIQYQNFVSQMSFNPLDRVKFVQIVNVRGVHDSKEARFNPLDRVKFV